MSEKFRGDLHWSRLESGSEPAAEADHARQGKLLPTRLCQHRQFLRDLKANLGTYMDQK